MMNDGVDDSVTDKCNDDKYDNWAQDDIKAADGITDVMMSAHMRKTNGGAFMTMRTMQMMLAMIMFTSRMLWRFGFQRFC